MTKSIYDFIYAAERDKYVCGRIDRFIGGEYEPTTEEVKEMLQSAEDVIGGYRTILYEILKDIGISDYIKTQTK